MHKSETDTASPHNRDWFENPTFFVGFSKDSTLAFCP